MHSSLLVYQYVLIQSSSVLLLDCVIYGSIKTHTHKHTNIQQHQRWINMTLPFLLECIFSIVTQSVYTSCL